MVVCKQNFAAAVRHENKIYSAGRQILALFCVARGLARADEILRDKISKISIPQNSTHGREAFSISFGF